MVAAPSNPHLLPLKIQSGFLKRAWLPFCPTTSGEFATPWVMTHWQNSFIWMVQRSFEVAQRSALIFFHIHSVQTSTDMWCRQYANGPTVTRGQQAAGWCWLGCMLEKGGGWCNPHLGVLPLIQHIKTMKRLLMWYKWFVVPKKMLRIKTKA